MRSPKSEPVTGPGDPDLDRKGLADRGGTFSSSAPSSDDGGTSWGGLMLPEMDPRGLTAASSKSWAPSVATAWGADDD